MLIHTVNAGESLYKIASYYQVPVSAVAAVNALPDPNQLTVGQALVIPTTDISYTVRPGDSLWKISQKYKVSVDRLASYNQITNVNLIYTGMVLKIPGKVKTTVSVNGFIYKLGDEGAAIVSQDAPYLTYLSPFAYLISEDGSLKPISDGPAVEAAKARNVLPMMAITNFTATARGENLAHIVLNSPQASERLLGNILGVMQEKGYRGLNVDFENVLPEDREAYNRFLERTVMRLHAQNYFVSTSLAPKTSATQAGLLYEAHDYEAHGRIVDFVILMTYEWGYRKGPPQAISPIDQIRLVLDYAVTVIPREKIMMGFQIYARDWEIPYFPGQEAETFSNQEAVLRAVKYGAPIGFDQKAQSPYFRYTDESGQRHEVWFEDARSAQAKFDTVKIYQLGGISYWALGYPFPQNWALLADNFNIKKY